MDATPGSSKAAEKLGRTAGSMPKKEETKKEVICDHAPVYIPRLPGSQLMRWRKNHVGEHKLMMRWLKKEPFKVGLLDESEVSYFLT